MKRIYMKQLLILASLFMSGAIAAQDDQLVFTPTSTKTASVAAASEDITGVIHVPSNVTLNGKDYAVTTVASNAFKGCLQLEEVVLPEGIEKIEYDAFWNSGIMRMTIPATTTSIADNPFGNCKRLLSFTLAEGNKNYYMSGDALIGRYSKPCLVYYREGGAADFTIPEEVGVIGPFAFACNSSLKSVRIPKTVQEVGKYAFSWCYNLEEVVWESTATNIPQYCFSNCDALRKFTMCNGNPISIEWGVFDSAYRNAVLYVPTGSAKYYQVAEGWKDFEHIVEIDMPDVEVRENKYLSLNDDQMILGYARDENRQSPYLLYGGMQGTHFAYIGFPQEWMAPFKGNSIRNIRFAVNDTTDVYDLKVFIGTEQMKSDLCLQDVPTPTTGWNEIELQKPYLITGDSIFVGVQFKFRKFRPFPLEWTEGGEHGSFFKYGPVMNYDIIEDQLDDYGSGYSYSLCIQCLVEGDRLPENLLHYSGLELDKKYFKPGDVINGNFYVRNIGRNPVGQPQLSSTIDGEEFSVTANSRIISNDSRKTSLSVKIPIEKSLIVGQHQLRLNVQSINGQQYLYDGGTDCRQTFKYYTQSMQRDRALVELFSSVGCGHSPWGYEYVNMVKSRYPDAACVLYYRGAPETVCEDYIESLITGFPTIYIGRFGQQGATTLKPVYSNAVEEYEAALARPAFTNVNIASQYDNETRELNIHVSGMRNEEFIPVEGQTNLTVFLVEDGVRCAIWSESDKEIQDDILRLRLTDVWGAPVVWNGDSYEMDFSTALPETWNPAKMRIIAFLAKPFTGSNFDEMDVHNCNIAPLGDNSASSIQAIPYDCKDNAHLGVFNLQGQLVSKDPRHLDSLPSGIYIVKGKKIAVSRH